MNTFDAKLKKLAIERVELRIKQGHAAGIYQLRSGGKEYTAEEILDEMKKGTPEGDEFIWAEKKLMDELKKKGGL